MKESNSKNAQAQSGCEESTDGKVQLLASHYKHNNDAPNFRKEWRNKGAERRFHALKERKSDKLIKLKRDNKYRHVGEAQASLKFGLDSNSTKLMERLLNSLEKVTGTADDSATVSSSQSSTSTLDQFVRTTTRAVLGESFSLFHEAYKDNEVEIKQVSYRLACVVTVFAIFVGSSLSFPRKMGILATFAAGAYFFGDPDLRQALEDFKSRFSEKQAQSSDVSLECWGPLITLVVAGLMKKFSGKKELNWSSFVEETLITWSRTETPMNKAFEVMQDLFQKAYDFFFVGMLGCADYNFYQSALPQVDSWIDESLRLYKDFTHARVAHDEQLLKRVYALDMRGLELIGTLSKGSDRGLLSKMKIVAGKLNRIISELEMEGYFVTGEHSQPLFTVLFGSPGVGKSMVVKPLLYMFFAHILEGESLQQFLRRPDSFVFARCIENDYWEGYTGQPAVIYDDLAQTLPSNAGAANEMMEIIREANVFPYHLHYANMAMKVGKYFMSDVVLATTNVFDMRFTAQKYVSNPEAVDRRIDVWVLVTVGVEFCTQATKSVPNLADRRLDKTKLESGFRPEIYEFYSCRRDKVGQLHYTLIGGLPELVAVMVEKYKWHKHRHARVADDTMDLVRRIVEQKSKFPDCESQGVAASTIRRPVQWLARGMKSFEEYLLSIDESQDYEECSEEVYYDCHTLFEEILYDSFIGDYSDDLLYELTNFGSGASQIYREYLDPFWFEDFGPGACELTHEFLNTMFKDALVNFDGQELVFLTNMQYLSSCTYLRYIRDPFTRLAVRLSMIAVPNPPGADMNEFITTSICCFNRVLYLAATSVSNDADVTLNYARKYLDSYKAELTEKYPYVVAGGRLLLCLSAGFLVYKSVSVLIGMFSDDSSQGTSFTTIPDIVAQGKDQTLQDVINKVLGKNTYALMHGDTLQCFGIFVYENFFMVPTHMCSVLKHKVGNKAFPLSLLDLNNQTLACLLTKEDVDSQYVPDPDLDVSILTISSIRKHADLRSFLLPKQQIVNLSRGDIVMVRYNENPGGDFIKVQTTMPMAPCNYISYLDTKGQRWNNARSLQYQGHTRKGDCGLPVFSTDTSLRNMRLLGIHVAGSDQTFSGFSAVLYSEMFESTIVAQGSDFRRIKFYKHLPRSPGTNMKSQILKSPSWGVLAPCKTKPCHLRKFVVNGREIDPWSIAIGKYDKPAPTYIGDVEKLVQLSVRDMFDVVTAHPTHFRVLELEEVVKGIPGDKAFPSLDRGTSAGYPWNVTPKPGFPGKTRFFGFSQEFEMDDSNPDFVLLKSNIHDYISMYALGERPEFFFTGSLKDERKEIRKVDLGKTRYFAGSNLEYTLIFNMYFGSFKAHCYNNRIQIPACVGINPYSQDWDLLGKSLLAVGNNIIACDIKEFDSTQRADILRWIGDFIIEYMNLSREIQFIQRGIWKEVYASRHIFGSSVFEWDGCLPSGHPLTTIINCIFSNFLYRYCWHHTVVSSGVANDSDFRSYVKIAVYGDDMVAAISSSVSDLFNQITITSTLLNVGVVCTDELKSESPPKYRKLTEVSFLKRGFRYDDELGRWLAPLSILTLDELPSWTKKGPDRLIIPITNCELLVRELTLHGREVFLEYLPRVKKLLWEFYGYPLRETRFNVLRDEVTKMEYRKFSFMRVTPLREAEWGEISAVMSSNDALLASSGVSLEEDTPIVC